MTSPTTLLLVLWLVLLKILLLRNSEPGGKGHQNTLRYSSNPWSKTARKRSTSETTNTKIPKTFCDKSANSPYKKAVLAMNQSCVTNILLLHQVTSHKPLLTHPLFNHQVMLLRISHFWLLQVTLLLGSQNWLWKILIWRKKQVVSSFDNWWLSVHCCQVG